MFIFSLPDLIIMRWNKLPQALSKQVLRRFKKEKVRQPNQLSFLSVETVGRHLPKSHNRILHINQNQNLHRLHVFQVQKVPRRERTLASGRVARTPRHPQGGDHESVCLSDESQPEHTVMYEDNKQDQSQRNSFADKKRAVFNLIACFVVAD